MGYWLPLLLIVHAVPAAFWMGVTGVLANLGTAGSELPLKGPQTGSSLLAVIFGGTLWIMLGYDLSNTGGIVLGTGALCAIAALVLQQLVAWPALRRGQAGGSRFALAQRISAVLLVVTMITMVTFRYI